MKKRNNRKARRHAARKQHVSVLPLPELDFEKPSKEEEKEAAENIQHPKIEITHKSPANWEPMHSPVHQEPIHDQQQKPEHFKRPFMHRFYFFLSKFATRSQRNSLKKKLYFAGVDEEAEIWLGQVLLLAKLSAIATFLAIWVCLREMYFFNLSAYALLAFLIVIAGAYIHLNVEIEDRKKRLEEILPDAMQVIAANIRAGMTPVVALRAAARPELGPLQEDIKFATTKSLGTGSFTDALREMGQKTSSELFQRIVALFTASLKSGGHLAQLLENTASDIRETQELKKDLVSSTRLYAIFIVFTVVIGTPLLLAVSIQFSGMVTGLQANTPSGGLASEISSAPLISTPLPIDFLMNSAIIIIIITTVLASALLGVINNGTYSSGLKYSPFLASAAIIFYFLMKDYALKAILPAG
ncbi:MAG: type II secretion system F family protein [Candidatus Micrarchaeota archaeon]